MGIFYWDFAKNKKLFEERGLTFEQIVHAIQSDRVLDVLDHPNQDMYKNQLLIIVEINDYAVVVPALNTQSGIFLKTAYKSRKMTKKYLGDT